MGKITCGTYSYETFLIHEVDTNKSLASICGLSFINNLIPHPDGILHLYELEKFQSIKHDHRRQQFIHGRLATKLAVQEFFRFSDLSQLAIVPGLFGKPRFVLPQSSLLLAISHSANLALCGATIDNFEIALDIETIDLNRKSIAALVLKSEEKGVLSNLIVLKPQELETLLFSAKEAAGKILGVSIVEALEILTLDQVEILSSQSYRIRFAGPNPLYVIAVRTPRLVGCIGFQKKISTSGWLYQFENLMSFLSFQLALPVTEVPLVNV